MRTIELKVGLGAGLALALILTLVGCGRDDDTSVRARNLLTGEIQDFASPGAVPPDWYPCQTPDCPVPPGILCQKLSDKTCTLNPGCRLKELWCEGTVSSDGTTTPGKCTYQCIPKLPLLCEELTAEKTCIARPDCDWGPAACPAMCADDGNGGCLPCPNTGMCYSKAPPICQQLTDATSCGARSDCEWEPMACALVCIDDGKGGCLPCPTDGVCVPKSVVPPPCPTIPPPPPGFCQGGTIVNQFGPDGCVVGYTCEMPQPNDCWSLNTAYINTIDKAKACNPFVMTPVNQCGMSIPTALFCPVCSTFVNAANTAALQALKTIEAKWLALQCDQMEVMCPMIGCQTSTSATCMPTAGSAGSCVDDLPPTP